MALYSQSVNVSSHPCKIVSIMLMVSTSPPFSSKFPVLKAVDDNQESWAFLVAAYHICVFVWLLCLTFLTPVIGEHDLHRWFLFCFHVFPQIWYIFITHSKNEISYFEYSDKFEVTARAWMTSDIIGLLLETFYPATVKTGLGTLRAHGRAVPTVCILKRLPWV